jgi:signal transduction histidine kinase
VSSVAILAEERGQHVTVDVADRVTVAADRLVLREAITNIVDNAIKYSPKGSTIDVRVSAGGNRALVEVADQGPGIAPEHSERIFDRFFRVDEGRSRRDGGAGLGLAIAKWAIEVHGGEISVGAGPRGGSIFRIALPIETTAYTDSNAPARHFKGEQI